MLKLIGSKTDKEQRDLLTKDLVELSKLKLQIDEQRSRLESISIDGVAIVVPDLPQEVKSDSFSGSGDDIMMTTDFTYAGGVNVNWRNLNLEDGYFDSINNKTINPDDLSLARWLVKLRNDASGTSQTTSYEHD